MIPLLYDETISSIVLISYADTEPIALDGSRDDKEKVVLSAKGRRQCFERRKWFHSLTPAPSFCITSPSERCKQTGLLMSAKESSKRGEKKQKIMCHEAEWLFEGLFDTKDLDEENDMEFSDPESYALLRKRTMADEGLDDVWMTVVDLISEYSVPLGTLPVFVERESFLLLFDRIYEVLYEMTPSPRQHPLKDVVGLIPSQMIASVFDADGFVRYFTASSMLKPLDAGRQRL